MTNSRHVPVMLQESLEGFAGANLRIFLDGTLGAGGHAKAFLEAHPEIELYIGCDQDLSSLELAKQTLEPWKEKMLFIHGNFRDLDVHLQKHNIQTVDGFFLI